MSEKIELPKLSDISAMCIDDLAESGFTLSHLEKNSIDGTGLVNIFIGENNAGKSRLLRKILTSRIASISINSSLRTEIKEAFLNTINIYSRSNHRGGFVYKRRNYHRFNEQEVLIIKTKLDRTLPNLLDSQLRSDLEESLIHALASEKNQLSERVSFALDLDQTMKIFKDTKLPYDELITQLESQREYIPILRGLRPLSPQEDLFKKRTERDYFSSKEATCQYSIFTGYSLYSDLVHSLLGLERERKSVKDFQNYLSKHFFTGKEVTLIPKKDRDGGTNSNDVVYVKVGDDQELPIYELGDGIQAIITLTVRPFLTHKPTAFFIEEPELCSGLMKPDTSR